MKLTYVVEDDKQQSHYHLLDIDEKYTSAVTFVGDTTLRELVLYRADKKERLAIAWHPKAGNGVFCALSEYVTHPGERIATLQFPMPGTISLQKASES